MLVIISVILALIAIFTLWLIILPYFKLQTFKRHDSQIYFYPLIGILRRMLVDFKNHGDAKASSKSWRTDFPDHRFAITNFGTEPVISLKDTQLIKELTQKPQFYQRGALTGVFDYILGNGLVVSDGETWKQHRKFISASFNYDLLKANVSVIQDTVVEFLNKITPEDMKHYSVLKKSKQITGEIVGRIFFGASLNSYSIDGKPLTMEFADLIDELGILLHHPLHVVLEKRILDIPLPRFRHVKMRVLHFRKVVSQIISDRKTQPEPSNDLLGRLLATQNNPDSECNLSDQDIADQFCSFFLAGMDTTAHLVSMAIYCIAQNPEYLKELERERAATYNTEETKTVETLQKMDMLHAVCKETLRLYSPFPFLFMRRCVQAHTLGDLNIRKGDWVEADFLPSLYDGKIFDEPTKFKPNRWRDPNFKCDPYAFIPFSAGPRNCIGQHLAIIEAKVIVSELLNRFDFRLRDDYKLKLALVMALEPEEDMLWRLTPKA